MNYSCRLDSFHFVVSLILVSLNLKFVVEVHLGTFSGRVAFLFCFRIVKAREFLGL